jgi:hypothetical protein
MDHIYYFDGNEKKISWTIENHDARSEQSRIHIEDYYEKISLEQSKYVALHVGIFWSIGRFIIKHSDTVNIMIDLKSMFKHITEKKTHDDPFVNARIRFIEQLIDQRKLSITYKMIVPSDNKASLLLL